MRTLFSCAVGLAVSVGAMFMLLYGATAQAGVLPVDKRCGADGCQSSYVVSQSGIVCANCQTAVNTQARPRVRVVRSTREAAAQGEETAGESGAGRLESSHSVAVLQPQSDRQLDIIYRLYLPGRGGGSGSALKESPMMPAFDVDQLVDGWAGNLYLTSDLERATEVILEHWQGEGEQVFDKRLQMAKIRWPHYLPLPTFNRAVMAAMVLQDRLKALKEFEGLLENGSETLITLTLFFLDLEHELAALQEHERVVQQGWKNGQEEVVVRDDSAEESVVSAHFAGMHIGDSEHLSRLKALDVRLEQLQTVLALSQEHTALFRQVFGEEYHNFRQAFSIHLSPWFTATDEPVTEKFAVGVGEKQELGYFSGVLNYPKPESQERSRQELAATLSEMTARQLLSLKLGHMEWLVRRSENDSTYQLYLPGFWSADFANSDALLGGIEVLHRSMMEAMKVPLEEGVGQRVLSQGLRSISDGFGLGSDTRTSRRQIIISRMSELMGHPIVPAVAVAATVVTGGILARQYFGGKSASM